MPPPLKPLYVSADESRAYRLDSPTVHPLALSDGALRTLSALSLNKSSSSESISQLSTIALSPPAPPPYDPLPILNRLSQNSEAIWAELVEETKEIGFYPPHVESRALVANQLHAVAVDVIACPALSRVDIQKNGKRYFWHANFIPNQIKMKTIATQLPATKTAVDLFWLGTWQENVSTIVNITKTTDNQRQISQANFSTIFTNRLTEYKKLYNVDPSPAEQLQIRDELAHQTYQINLGIGEEPNHYWPAEGKSFTTTDGITVTHLSTTDKGNNLFVTEIQLKNGDEERTLLMYRYPNWNDKSDVASKELSLLAQLASKQHPTDGEERVQLVHCRAGVGRSGTFIFTEQLIRWLQLAREGKVKPPKMVDIKWKLILNMRAHRDHQCIQTYEQFQCAIQAVKEAFTLPGDAIKA